MMRPDPFGDKEAGGEAANGNARGVNSEHVRALQRHIAEVCLEQDADINYRAAETLSQDEAKRLLYELRVHQIELEMQNEALRESQIALDAVRARYFDLYDLAPIAYCTVSEQGLIWQANLAAATLFGLTRNALLNQPFSRFVFVEDQDIYYLGRRRLASGGGPQSFELRLAGRDGAPFWAGMTIDIGRDSAGKPELRMVLSEVGARRKTAAEQERLRQKLAETNAWLASAGVAASAAASGQSDRIAPIIDEIDARLQAILCRLEAARSIPLTAEQRHRMDQIRSASCYLATLLDDRLDAAALAEAEKTASQA